jgi:glycosyltransferase involved in cell wall biosynthesis
MNNPLVSIVVPTCNRRRFLGLTLESIMAQHYRPVEILVLDDGSTDNTKELIKRYGGRVRYFWQENQGIAATRTQACKLANGEFIAFQDDDDLMPPDRIVCLHQALRNHPSAVLATGDFEIIDTDGNPSGIRWLRDNPDKEGEEKFIRDGYHALMWPTVPAAPHTTLFRKSDGERIGWFDNQFIYACSDKDFLARLAQLGPIVYVRKIVSYYRQGHTAIWSNTLKANYCKIMLYEKHMRLLDKSQRKLYKRLQFRTLGTLKTIAKGASRGMSLDDPEFHGYVQRGLSLIGAKNRLRYRWYRWCSSVKLVLRR